MGDPHTGLAVPVVVLSHRRQPVVEHERRHDLLDDGVGDVLANALAGAEAEAPVAISVDRFALEEALWTECLGVGAPGLIPDVESV